MAASLSRTSSPVPQLPQGVAVNAGHVYWSNDAGGSIGRANLDGSGVNQGFITGANHPDLMAIDGGHIYWANESANTIGRANLDGSGVNESFITGASHAARRRRRLGPRLLGERRHRHDRPRQPRWHQR